MSVETLIFLAIFFLLPLLERLLERNRRRGQAPPERTDSLDPMQEPRRRAPAPTPAPTPPPRPVPPPPPVPVETRVPDDEGPVVRRPMPPAPAPSSRQPGRPAEVGPRPVPAEARTPGRQPGMRQPGTPRPAPRSPRPAPQFKQAPAPQVIPAEVRHAVAARERREAQRSAAAADAAHAAQRRARRSLQRILENPQALRQAVVLAEVLGPCRALETDKGR